MRTALLIRFLIGIAIGLAVAVPVSEVAFAIQGNNTSRPPKTVVLTIPPGTALQVAAGTSLLPKNLVFVLGDTLLVNNQDSVVHTLGPLVIPPHSSASLKLDHPGGFSYVCSFQPSKYLGLDVNEALTPLTRIEGIVIAGVPFGMLLALYSLILRPLKKAVVGP